MAAARNGLDSNAWKRGLVGHAQITKQNKKYGVF